MYDERLEEQCEKKIKGEGGTLHCTAPRHSCYPSQTGIHSSPPAAWRLSTSCTTRRRITLERLSPSYLAQNSTYALLLTAISSPHRSHVSQYVCYRLPMISRLRPLYVLATLLFPSPLPMFPSLPVPSSISPEHLADYHHRLLLAQQCVSYVVKMQRNRPRAVATHGLWLRMVCVTMRTVLARKRNVWIGFKGACAPASFG